MKKTNKENPITFFRKANEARQKLVKKSMGGPGSGMGTMYKNDLAFDSMMNQTSEPDLSKELSNRYANIKPTISKPTNATRANQSVEQISPADALRKAEESNAINAKKTSFQDLKKRYNNVTPVITKPSGVREGRTPEETRLLNSGAKKGGAVKRKKK